MRALSADRLLPWRNAPRKAKPGEAMLESSRKPLSPSARRSPTRKAPPPPWRKPALLAVGSTAYAAALAVGAYLAWQAGYPAVLQDAAAKAFDRVQIAFGLSLQEVLVEGRERASADALLAALGVVRGEPILGIDLAAAQARLARVDWVKSAAVSRRLPRTIQVEVQEYRPLAIWQYEGKLSLIDRDGEVITDRDIAAFGALPVLVGEDAPNGAAKLIAMLDSEPEIFSKVEAAVRVGGRRWNLRLEGGIEVRLPAGDEAAAWHRLAALEREHAILARDLVAIDLRLPDRLIVRMAPGAVERARDPGEKT